LPIVVRDIAYLNIAYYCSLRWIGIDNTRIRAADGCRKGLPSPAGVEYGGRETVGDFSKSTDGDVGINPF